jgi:DUF3108-like
MTRLRLFVFALMSIFMVSTAHAQSYGPPTYSEGDEWTFTNRTIKVVKIDGNVTVMTGINVACAACLYHLDSNNDLTIIKVTTADGSPPDSASIGWLPAGPEWKYWSFPLEVNKTWRFSAPGFYQRAIANYTVDTTVEKYEDVTVKAGTFKAFKVRREWTRRTTSREDKWAEYLWFAPDAKISVKSTSNVTQHWELLSYRLK